MSVPSILSLLPAYCAVALQWAKHARIASICSNQRCHSAIVALAPSMIIQPLVPVLRILAGKPGSNLGTPKPNQLRLEVHKSLRLIGRCLHLSAIFCFYGSSFHRFRSTRHGMCKGQRGPAATCSNGHSRRTTNPPGTMGGSSFSKVRKSPEHFGPQTFPLLFQLNRSTNSW